MSRKYLEKFWDCPVCGKKHISALRNTRCPSCGSTKVPQDKELFSYEEITDTVGLALAQGAPHWTCNHCGAVNLNKNSHCDGCGDIRDGEDNTNQIRTISNFDQKVAESEQSGSKNFPASIHTSASSDFKPEKKINKKLLISLVIVISVALLGFLGFLFFHTNTYSAQVTSFSWKRVINIEEYTVLSEEGWSSPPFDAYNISQETRFHHNEPIYETRTEEVYVPGSYTSYTDNGNGSVTAETIGTSHYETRVYQELVGYTPIYQTWYTYNVNRWVYSRNVTTQKDDHAPEWGKYTLHFDGQTIIGAEKVEGTTESYTVVFQALVKDEVETFSLSANLDDWNAYVLDNTYTIKVNHFNMITNNPLHETN